MFTPKQHPLTFFKTKKKKTERQKVRGKEKYLLKLEKT